MRQTLLIGGAGFIGSAVAKVIGEDSVTIFDNFASVSHSDSTIKEAVNSSAEIFVGDVTNLSDITDLFSSGVPEDIIYLAAETGTGRSLGNCGLNTRVNTVGLANTLDALSAGGVMPRNIVLTSTRAVYGEGPYINNGEKIIYPDQRTEEELARGEFEFSGLDPLLMNGLDHQPNPCNIYGATKLSQEHILRIWTAAHAVSCSIVRFQNVYGAGQSLTNPYTGILIHFIKQILSKSSIEIYENGGITRDFIHVQDAAACLSQCLTNRKSNALYDCGSGDRIKLEDVARYLSELGGGVDPVYVDKYRLGDVRHACADINSAVNDLEWTPKVELKDGLADLYQAVKAQIG